MLVMKVFLILLALLVCWPIEALAVETLAKIVRKLGFRSQ